MITDESGKKIKAAILIFLLICPFSVFSQCYSGRVLSGETNNGIGFSSIGIIGTNIGTVSDQNGFFTLNVDESYNNDSLRFSMIGFEPLSLNVKKFKESAGKIITLKPVSYALNEVKVVYCKPKKIRLGAPVSNTNLRSGFGNNDLGSEMGIKINVKKKVRLRNLNLNVALCTYDSVTYRLNIYQSDRSNEYKNILTKPIYISFTKDRIGDVLTFDLSEYSIMIEGNAVIALELYKDLGKGKLLFKTQYFTGSTLHRKTCMQDWAMAPGAIGMYLNSNEIGQ